MKISGNKIETIYLILILPVIIWKQVWTVGNWELFQKRQQHILQGRKM